MSAEQKLAQAGVFKGMEGLRRLAEADEFWEAQNYGTRLYFGPGISDYLHRGVLRSAIEVLDSEQLPPAPRAEESRLVTKSDAMQIWALGYQQGHSDGITCGHPQALRCSHIPDHEAEIYLDDYFPGALASQPAGEPVWARPDQLRHIKTHGTGLCVLAPAQMADDWVPLYHSPQPAVPDVDALGYRKGLELWAARIKEELSDIAEYNDSAESADSFTVATTWGREALLAEIEAELEKQQ